MKLVTQLLDESEHDLLVQLGAYSVAISSGSSPSAGVFPDDEAIEKYLGEDEGFLLATGRKVLKRTSQRLHLAVCGAGDEETQKSLRSALADNKAAFATLLVTLLVQIGVTSPIALIAATLIANALFEASKDVLCEGWAEYNDTLQG
jgi:hypothetical protein